MRPIFIPEPQILSKIYQKFHSIFDNWLSFFSSKFRKFCYQIDEIGPIFAAILENFENMTHVYTSFCTE